MARRRWADFADKDAARRDVGRQLLRHGLLIDLRESAIVFTHMREQTDAGGRADRWADRLSDGRTDKRAGGQMGNVGECEGGRAGPHRSV